MGSKLDRSLPLALGALSISSGLALLTFDILFSITLSRDSAGSGEKVVAIVASGLEGATVALVSGLLGRQIRNRSHIQSLGRGRRTTYILAGGASLVGLGAVASSAATFGLAQSKNLLPNGILGASCQGMLIGGFICCAAALVSLAAFVICIAVIQRRDLQQQIQPYRAKADEQQETGVNSLELPTTPNSRRTVVEREKASPGSRSSPSHDRSRTASIRSSLSQVVRPVTSKTKLVSKTPYRGTSMESHREEQSSLDDGFDSWDTSTVDAQSRHAVESVSPTPPRFLETIPASPNGSRSPSPGFPLDLQPPKTRRRSRSFSPSTSYTELPKSSRVATPEVSNEGHIHPLFRTDSPTPPPAATPGTMVHAAPGNGLVISDRQSIRSLTRLRSGSLPASPLFHSPSLDSIRAAIEREERGHTEEKEVIGERTLTPPIPDFVMHGTPRSSMQGYARRKVSARGLNKVGEDAEA